MTKETNWTDKMLIGFKFTQAIVAIKNSNSKNQKEKD